MPFLINAFAVTISIKFELTKTICFFSYQVQSDWQFLAVLLDRLFLWLSAFSCLVGWLFVLGYVLSFA